MAGEVLSYSYSVACILLTEYRSRGHAGSFIFGSVQQKMEGSVSALCEGKQVVGANFRP
jgi:hypothetical protein